MGAMLAIALGAAVVAAGCSTPPGTAAVVDGRTITHDYLEETRQDMEGFLTRADSATTLGALIAAPYFIDAADEHGVGASEAEARAAIEDALVSVGREDLSVGDGAVEIIRFTMAIQKIQALPDGAEILAETDARVLAAETQISPRYGELDPRTGRIVRDGLPWVVPQG